MSNTRCQQPRYILVHNEKCEYSCSNCYYKFRNHRTKKDSNIIDEFVGEYKPDHAAVGFNSGWYDNEIDLLNLLSSVNPNVDIVATCSLDNDLLVCVSEQLNFDTDVLCISYNDINISEKIYSNIYREWNEKILNITDDCIVDTKELPPSFYKLANVVDSIYLLMSKGPVGKWRMTDERIRIYEKKLDILKSITSTPVLIDECVYGIMTGGIGNCRGEWLEVNSYGEVRTCPYSSEPTKTFRYGINLDEIEFPKICKCRRSI